jgi:hypothetical protein
MTYTQRRLKAGHPAAGRPGPGSWAPAAGFRREESNLDRRLQRPRSSRWTTPERSVVLRCLGPGIEPGDSPLMKVTIFLRPDAGRGVKDRVLVALPLSYRGVNVSGSPTS